MAIFPLVSCGLATFVTLKLHLFIAAALISVLAIASLGFFLTVTGVFLEGLHVVKLTPEGAKISRYTIWGPRSTFCPTKEISYFTANIDGGDKVLLCLQLKNNTKRPLLSTPVEDINNYVDKLTSIMKKNYVATLDCVRVIAPPPIPMPKKPDAIAIDVTSKVVRFKMPDHSTKEFRTSKVSSIELIGPREGPLSILTETVRSVEYICEPIMCMEDGTLYVLQRFCSIEPAVTTTSKALVSATKTVEYLKSCIS